MQARTYRRHPSRSMRSAQHGQGKGFRVPGYSAAACQALWKRMEERGHIYLGSYAGWYAVRDEAFYDEDELTAGPNGKKIAPSGAECEWVEEPSYFFRLSAWAEPLLKFYEAHPDFIAPTARNEVVSFVRGCAIVDQRTTFDWGVPAGRRRSHHVCVARRADTT